AYISSSPAIDADGTIYFGSTDNFFYALNPDGTLNWKKDTGHSVTSSATIADGVIYIGNSGGKIYGFGKSL
ncbi:MAG: PQQ-binding-like beta-propeller repeat protein, partial [bacterium]